MARARVLRDAERRRLWPIRTTTRLAAQSAGVDGPRIISPSTDERWFDESKKILADPRHRALRHHAEGIFLAESIFGLTLTNSRGREIPVRWVGEQHVQEDLGWIPSAADWLRAIQPEPWMTRGGQRIQFDIREEDGHDGNDAGRKEGRGRALAS